MLSFTLSGIGFQLASASARVLAAAEGLFAGYAGGDGAWELFYEEASPWVLPDPLSRTLIMRGNQVSLGGEFAGEIDLQARRARFRIGATPELLPPGSLQNTLRVILVLALAEHGGLLLHAASFAWQGKAWVFFGESGAGKSTLARGFPPGTLLSDEICCIDGTGVAHRAPFTGETLPPAVPLSAPVSALFSLQQAAALRIEKLGTKEALRALLRCVVHVGHDRQLTARLIDNASRWVDRIYCMQTPIAPDLLPALGSLNG